MKRHRWEISPSFASFKLKILIRRIICNNRNTHSVLGMLDDASQVPPEEEAVLGVRALHYIKHACMRRCQDDGRPIHSMGSRACINECTQFVWASMLHGASAAADSY